MLSFKATKDLISDLPLSTFTGKETISQPDLLINSQMTIDIFSILKTGRMKLCVHEY